MKVYIAGPVTGQRGFMGRFEAAAFRLRTLGYEPFNPVAFEAAAEALWREGYRDGDGQWPGVMRACIKDLLACDAFTLLPGWADSRGAVLETLIARSLRLPYVALDVPEGDVERTVLTVRFEVTPFAVEDDEHGKRYYAGETVEKLLNQEKEKEPSGG